MRFDLAVKNAIFELGVLGRRLEIPCPKWLEIGIVQGVQGFARKGEFLRKILEDGCWPRRLRLARGQRIESPTFAFVIGNGVCAREFTSWPPCEKGAMIRIDSRQEERDVSDSFVKTRLEHGLDQMAERNHVVHVQIAEFAFMPGTTLLPVKQAGVGADERAEHLDQVLARDSIAEQLRGL